MLVGAIEAGGTKFLCAVAISSGEIMKSVSIPTRDVETTMQEVVAFFKPFHIKNLGVGCFGPVCLNKEDPLYGSILDTPKQKWRYFDIYHYLKEHLQVNVYMHTDVVASAYGEYYYGFNQTISDLIYVTIGTGIGAGVIHKGSIIMGSHHTEMGHFPVSRRQDDDFKSVCMFHNDCLEGLASGISLDQRYQVSHKELTLMEDVWELEGYYIAQALYSYSLTFSPKKIIIGGGVSHQSKLFPAVRKHFEKLNNGYYIYQALENLDEFIIPPKLGDHSALYGAIALAVKKV